MLILFPVELIGGMPPNGFPRGPDPPALFEKNHINVVFERSPESAMTEEEFMKGFEGMKTSGRRHWLQDILDGKFKMVLKRRTPASPAQAQDDVDSENAAGHMVGGDGT